MKKTRIISAVFCLLALAALCGCGKDTDKGSSQTTAAVNMYADMNGAIKIDTEYGTLYFPDQWADHLRVGVTDEDDGPTVTFSARIGDKEYPLFDFAIGHEQGTEVGSLTDANGNVRTVYLRLRDIEFDSELNGEERSLLYAMQEDVNFMIDSLS